jgi:phage shock protein A
MRRLWLIIKAKFSKAREKAEDPMQTLDYGYEKQLELLQGVKRGIADVVTAKKRLEAQQRRLQDQVDKLDGQARQALEAGNEDLARLAVERKLDAQRALEPVAAQVQELQAQQDALTQRERQLRTKIASFRTKKEILKAQYKAAEAQVAVSEAMSGAGGEFAQIGSAIQRAQDKVEDSQARAAALQELEDTGVFDNVLLGGNNVDDIDRQIAQATASARVDAELEAMKVQPALEAGQQNSVNTVFGADSRVSDKTQ